MEESTGDIGKASPVNNKNVPTFIKQFSKDYSVDARQQLATEIRTKRKEYFAHKKDVLEQEEGLETTEDQLSQAASLKQDFNTLSSETQGMLRSFYTDQAKKWDATKYSKEEVTQYFKEENLVSLNLDDYILLLRRFPNQMVTHVTRQGVRDHFGHGAHTAGLAEFHNGFEKILKDGRLRSVIGAWMTTSEKDKAITDYLKLYEVNTKKEAIDWFNNVLSRNHAGNPGSYSDLIATHFAAEEVADAYYGGESGNEIFFTIPSLHIASQYRFNGPLNETGDQSATNDIWVWANEEKGVNINAGLAFIPADAKVGRSTGSKYEIDANGRAVVNTDLENQARKFVQSPKFQEFAEQASDASSNLFYDNLVLEHEQVAAEQPEFQELEVFKDRLRDEFGITDERLQYALLDTWNLNLLLNSKENGEGESTAIMQALLHSKIYLKEASDSISSKEYWENYFNKHPELRPSKIVYYEGEDPTAALNTFREEGGITKVGKKSALGFSEHHAFRESRVGMKGVERARSVIMQAVENVYS